MDRWIHDWIHSRYIINMKICSQCRKAKKDSDFYRCKVVKSGLTSKCKECHSEVNRKSREKNIAHVRKTYREYDKTRRVKIEKVCFFCNTKFLRRDDSFRKNKHTFCSTTCYHKWAVGSNMSFFRGDDVSYSGLHGWISYRFAKSNTCDFCNKNIRLGEYKRT